jgi:hypothetical protein
MNTHTTRIYYLRSIPRQDQKRGDPIACLMTSVDRAGNVIKYSLATMHPKDDFKKEIGRKIASGRLKENPALVWSENMPTSGHIISRMIMQDIVDRFDHSTRFKREYILRTYGNTWSYHIPARVAKSAQRWLDEANKPREQVKTYMLEQKEARVFTQQDLTSSYTGSITCDPKDVKVWNETEPRSKSTESVSFQMSRPMPIETVRVQSSTTVSNPNSGFVKYGTGEYAEWEKSGNNNYVRKPAYSNTAMQSNYEVFQKALPDMLTNKFLVGKFVIVSNQQVQAVFDTYQMALKYGILNYKVDEFLLQEVSDTAQSTYQKKSA